MPAPIFRTSWVYGARGDNFAKTMLRLARTRDALPVIDDQIGAPTGADLLADLTAQACRVAKARPELSGTYHAVAAGETNWHGYAKHVIGSARAGKRSVAPDAIAPIPTSAYPQAAPRPKNSRLDTTQAAHRLRRGAASMATRSGSHADGSSRPQGSRMTEKVRKGIILAGGSGTRLHPARAR